MTIISSDYSGLNAYAGTSLSSLLPSTSSTGKNEEDSTTGLLNSSDSVTLSEEALAAANRESLGLPATGVLTLSDFKATATEQEEVISTFLDSAMESLGIDADQQVSLSLNSDNEIEVENTFAGSDELEELLNTSSEFGKAFTGLTASNEVLDFADYLQEKVSSTSLVDYMNDDTSDTDLLSLAAEYAGIKAASCSLETLWRISHEATPYTYEYN
nr:hypothetical protein [uncultured Desulfobacter sp.]